MSGYLLKYPSPSDVSTWTTVGVPGGFGKVLKGTIKGKTVAIKVMRDCISKKRFVYLERMHGFNHRNLIKFKGLLETAPGKTSQQPHLVFQYANGCNLLDFVRRSVDGKEAGLKYDEYKQFLNLWSLHISSGMEYLHSKNLNHGTLAARNVLLDVQGDGDGTEFTAKISDYGMEELISGRGDNYHQLPSSVIIHARWTSADYIRDVENFECRGKSCDVWSFGVVLWEMWTKGEVPYRHINSNKKVIAQIRAGKSPLSFKTPERCPPEIIRIMDDTLRFDETRRPTFNTLRKQFENIRKKDAEVTKPPAGKSHKVKPPTTATPGAKSHYVGPKQTKPRPPRPQTQQIPAMQPPPPYSPQDPAQFHGNYANSAGWPGPSGFNPGPSMHQPMSQHFPGHQLNETPEAARIRELEKKIQALEMKQLEQTVKNLELQQANTSQQIRRRSKSKHRSKNQ